MASAAANLTALRQEYEEVAGKRPYWRWDATNLRSHIDTLLAEGRAAFFGTTEEARGWFASPAVGLPCAEGRNLADHLIGCVTVPRRAL